MKTLRKFCLGGLLLLYVQVSMGQDSIRTEHLQEVKVNARQHRFLRHSQIFEQLFVLINTKEVFWNIQALQYR